MTFTLLRKAPHVLKSYTMNEPWMNILEFKRFQRNKLNIAQLELENAGLKGKFDTMIGSHDT